MATVVKEIPKRSVGRPPKYPWSKWFDGQVWKLTQDVDFEISAATFYSIARNAAESRRMSVNIARRGKCIYVQADIKTRRS